MVRSFVRTPTHGDSSEYPGTQVTRRGRASGERCWRRPV